MAVWGECWSEQHRSIYKGKEVRKHKDPGFEMTSTNIAVKWFFCKSWDMPNVLGLVCGWHFVQKNWWVNCANWGKNYCTYCLLTNWTGVFKLPLHLQARLWQITKILPDDLANHLEEHAVLPVLYASSWLLTAFSADFPLFWSSRVLDVIFTDCYIEPMMKVRSWIQSVGVPKSKAFCLPLLRDASTPVAIGEMKSW